MVVQHQSKDLCSGFWEQDWDTKFYCWVCLSVFSVQNVIYMGLIFSLLRMFVCYEKPHTPLTFLNLFWCVTYLEFFLSCILFFYSLCVLIFLNMCIETCLYFLGPFHQIHNQWNLHGSINIYPQDEYRLSYLKLWFSCLNIVKLKLIPSQNFKLILGYL